MNKTKLLLKRILIGSPKNKHILFLTETFRKVVMRRIMKGRRMD